MIDTLTVPIERFDLAGFIGAYRRFYRRWVGGEADPDIAVTALERHGDTPESLAEGRNLDRGTARPRLPLGRPFPDERYLGLPFRHQPLTLPPRRSTGNDFPAWMAPRPRPAGP